MNYIEFTEFLVTSIVKDKDLISVKESVSDDDSVLINVYVSNEEIGKVIGKQGRTANAIRNLVQASVFSDYQKIKIDFHSYE